MRRTRPNSNYRHVLSKYGVRTDNKGKHDRTEDGILFASKRERKRYGELKLLERAGEITRLECQPAFAIVVSGEFGGPGGIIGRYDADFRYVDRPSGEVIVEDVKSPATRKIGVYRLKKKLVEALYPIKIREA
jgi:hypothetical protein